MSESAISLDSLPKTHFRRPDLQSAFAIPRRPRAAPGTAPTCPAESPRRRRLAAAAGLLVLACLWLIAITTPATAASADKGDGNASMAVQIEADHGQLNDKTGVSTYTGTVKVTRGQLTLLGDKLVITRAKNGKDYVADMTGSPAHLDQGINAQVKQEVTGTSRSIHYVTAEQMATLKGDAVLHQGRDVLRGESIHYNVRTREVNADSGTSKSRVKVILHPRKNNAGNGS